MPSKSPHLTTRRTSGPRFTIWRARPPAGNADDLLSLWMATDDAERCLGTLNFGAAPTKGGVARAATGCVAAPWCEPPLL
jgi:hypothetical protein